MGNPPTYPPPIKKEKEAKDLGVGGWETRTSPEAEKSSQSHRVQPSRETVAPLRSFPWVTISISAPGQKAQRFSN